MQKQGVFKPGEFISFLVSIVMILDSFSMIFFGFVNLIGSANADFIDLLKKEAMIRQAEIVLVLAFVYFLVCFVALIYWHGGGRIWTYMILGLASFHLIGAVYLLAMFDADSLSPLPYGSIILNLLVVIIIIYEWSKSGSRVEKSNA